jgi:hypothetical protein
LTDIIELRLKENFNLPKTRFIRHSDGLSHMLPQDSCIDCYTESQNLGSFLLTAEKL